MLAAGTRLGPYEILSPLGAGGMGEVYQARDSRLGRTVALKVLAPHVAEDPERRQRFEREARAISSLNHPHIAALYDIGSEDETDFFVMECVEGQTLADRLKKGALPLDEALRYGAQIADALDKAHRAGIVHRDLKPSNIMLTKSGVKILDFGLAKLEEREAGVVVDSSAPTEARTLTEEGTILGTLQYMAPEQLEGKSVDARADLFALGGILYEMVTGRRAFEGESRASLIAAILDRDPAPVSELAPTASPALDHAIRRCLEKGPDERWQTALDLGKQLEWIVTSAVERGASPSGGTRVGRLSPAIWGVALVAAFLGGVYFASDAPSNGPTVRAAIPLAPTRLAALEAWPAAHAPAIAISPDGERLAYVGERKGMTGVYLRNIDRSDAHWVEGTDGAWGPFFSPDGRWLGFCTRNGIWKAPVAGGAPVLIVREGGQRGASWGGDGHIYFTPSMSAGISRVSESGGEAEQLTAPDFDSEKSHRLPEALPKGKGILFTVGTLDIDAYDDARIEVLDRETGERRVLIEGGMNARYVATGHIIYARAGSLFAVRFDIDRLEVMGTPVAVLEGVITSTDYGPAHFAVSEDGLLVFVPGSPRREARRLVWVDRDGMEEPVSGFDRNLGHPRIAPDGSRVAVHVDQATVSVWIHELSRGTWTRLTRGWDNMRPIWEPNGSHVTFASNQTGTIDLFRVAADGSQRAERLTATELPSFPGSWSPNGSVVTFTLDDDIWAFPVEDATTAHPVVDSGASEMMPEISPDGRWLAFVSDDSGRLEVYLQPFPGPGPRIPVSPEGGTEPAWAAGGRELFYRHESRIMVVGIEPGPNAELSRPRLVCERPKYSRGTAWRNYDVTPDGRRILIVEEIEPEPLPDHLTLIVNWFDELESHFEESE